MDDHVFFLQNGECKKSELLSSNCVLVEIRGSDEFRRLTPCNLQMWARLKDD